MRFADFWTGRTFLFLTGLFSLAWFLIRVIPKPSRAAYPCQRAAFPVASAFVVWLLGVASATWAWRRGKLWSRHARFLRAGLYFCIAALAALGMLVSLPQSPVQAVSSPGHGPLGTGQGIHPGRVVWVHAPDATDWAGEQSSERWWQTNHTDLAVVESMFGQAIRNLAGEGNDAAAWNALFTHFNQSRGRGEHGYQAGEKIAIKINLTTINARSGSGVLDVTRYEKKASIMNTIDNSPQMLLCLLRHLVYTAGVRPADISLGDPTGFFPKFMWDMMHPEFPEVRYFDNYGGSGRTRTELSAVKFNWSSPDAARHIQQDYIPVPFAEATYLINFAVLKGHSTGITVCGKNLYGALLRCPDTYFRDARGPDRGGSLDYLNMHDSVPGFGRQAMGQYRAIVDLAGHPQLGGKTLLYLVDGLFGGYYWDSHPHPWKMAPFGNGVQDDWPSSLFASQDPVAIDSVAYDFLLNEWPQVVRSGGYSDPNFLQGSTEDFLHEEAQAGDAPSGTFYDPARDGHGLSSLGVHEHWNNATDRQYSRNRGLNEGIELVALRVNRELPHLTASRNDTQIRLSWPAAQTGFRLESTASLVPPIRWTPVAEDLLFYQGQNLVSNPAINAPRFFRLAR